jgi:hypothetical protein
MSEEQPSGYTADLTIRNLSGTGYPERSPETTLSAYPSGPVPNLAGTVAYSITGGPYIVPPPPPVRTLTRYKELPPNTVMFSWSHFPDEYATNGRCDEVSLKPILNEASDPSITIESCISFSDFTEILFAQVGENDEEPWIYLVKHKDGYYVCFDAWCDYTGFDCRGVVKITYSRNRENMIQFGLDEQAREVMKSGVNYVVRDNTVDFFHVWREDDEANILALEREGDEWIALIPSGGSRTFTRTNLIARAIGPCVYFVWSDTSGWTRSR